MGRYFKVLGVATLVAASLNAAAGLCFCHRGPDAPASRPGHSCCHPDGEKDTLSLSGVDGCCHIEAAQRDMTPADAVPLTAPAHAIVAVVAPADEAVSSRSLTPSFAPSPPVRILRL